MKHGAIGDGAEARNSMAPRLVSNPYQNQVVKAIGLMVLATICLAGLDTTAKYLTEVQKVPVSEVVWMRFAWHVVFSAIVLWPFALRPSLRSATPGIQFVRSCLMILTTALNFIALKYLQLDQNIAIFFLMPLLVAALSGPLLGEWVGWHRALAIFAGFIGVLVVMHPGIGEVHWAMLFTLGATFGYALFTIATRYLAAYDPPAVTQTYTPLVGVLIMAPFALNEWHSPEHWWVWLLFASLGFWGGLGHWIIILAHRLAPANVLAPYIYLGLIWMSAFGFVIFDDVPTWWTVAGAAIVILAGLYLLARERIAEDRERKRNAARSAGAEFEPPQ
ncbi:DMT family transporter [Methyloceanibacter sp. wino2]|uniref:DMT family transporter n=1 Tax=Methyloceanibacter sp. wino2 TaxID=2170729 RepID=UPI000D3EA2A9|nr:DMT family transporter [Methyloceanibacter sp. wino2]